MSYLEPHKEHNLDYEKNELLQIVNDMKRPKNLYMEVQIANRRMITLDKLFCLSLRVTTLLNIKKTTKEILWRSEAYNESERYLFTIEYYEQAGGWKYVMELYQVRAGQPRIFVIYIANEVDYLYNMIMLSTTVPKSLCVQSKEMLRRRQRALMNNKNI